jgi:hypothetical protein
MQRRRALRDFIYVSESKVSRLFDAIPPGRFSRVSGVNASVLGSGGGVDLHTTPARSTVAELPAVEKRVREDFGVRALSDERLAGGDWLECTDVTARYGSPVPGLGAVVFLIEGSAMSVLLVGSSTSMRDGSPVVVDAPFSDWGAPTRVLRHAASEEALSLATTDEWSGRSERRISGRDGQGRELGPARDLPDVLGKFGYAFQYDAPSRSVSFVAQVTEVLPPDEEGVSWVLGTPLYVEAAEHRVVPS